MMSNAEFFNRNPHVAKIDTSGIISRPPPSSAGDTESSELKEAIVENALGPKKVSGDAGSVEQHSLKDQIAAERFLASKKAARKPGLGIRLTKLSPDGTT